MYRIIVTGASGFVGSSISCALHDSIPNVEVIGIDNLSRKGSWLNLERLNRKGITFHHGDLRFYSDIENLGRFDWLIDCSANPSVLSGTASSTTTSRQLVDHNLISTINLLEACKKWKAGLILVSTSRVYSIKNLSMIPMKAVDLAFAPDLCSGSITTGLSSAGITEDFPSIPPLSIYGSTKLCSEIMALEYAEAFDLNVIINRCGVLAGAGQFGKADQGIFSFWIHSWKEQRPLKYIGFMGSGFQVRDILHPLDLSSLIIKQISSHNNTQSHIFNVGGGIKSALSLKQLSELCTRRWGRREVGKSYTQRQYDIPWLVLDTTKTRQFWDWEPSLSNLQIFEEIADFADRNDRWIEITRD